MGNGSNSSLFKIPANECMFKVQLDLEIPIFNLGIEETRNLDTVDGYQQLECQDKIGDFGRPKRDKNC